MVLQEGDIHRGKRKEGKRIKHHQAIPGSSGACRYQAFSMACELGDHYLVGTHRAFLSSFLDCPESDWLLKLNMTKS